MAFQWFLPAPVISGIKKNLCRIFFQNDIVLMEVLNPVEKNE
jgi:hypothetical protein